MRREGLSSAVSKSPPLPVKPAQRKCGRWTPPSRALRSLRPFRLLQLFRRALCRRTCPSNKASQSTKAASTHRVDFTTLAAPNLLRAPDGSMVPFIQPPASQGTYTTAVASTPLAASGTSTPRQLPSLPVSAALSGHPLASLAAPTAPPPYHCEPCGITPRSEAGYQRHMKSNSHRHAVASAARRAELRAAAYERYDAYLAERASRES